jgi:putative transport protein
MQWLVDLLNKPEGVAHSVLVVALVSAIGLAIGNIKFKGVGLGIAGVLFVGLLFAHFGITLHKEVLEFLRDFGLILFVFTIGLQVGPGFFASLRRNGLPLNIAAACIVLGGAAVMVVQYKLLLPNQLPAAVGLMSGATTNTPSMAAAQATFEELRKTATDDQTSDSTSDATIDPTKSSATRPVSDAGLPAPTQESVAVTSPAMRNDPIATIGSAYAIAYPMGICGLLLSMSIIRWVFRIDITEEKTRLAIATNIHPSLDCLNFEVANPALVGLPIKEIPTYGTTGVVITRLLRNEQVEVADTDAPLQAGDVLTAVGPKDALRDFERIVGRRATVDARRLSSHISTESFLVSNKKTAGRTIEELQLYDRFDVAVTRILRSGIELPVTPTARLIIGDRVMAVGERKNMDAVAKELGNNLKSLDRPMLIPILLGIALGVIVGMFPINVGMTMPVRLGLAGGPLIVALLLSRIHRFGPFVWYMPEGANYMLRELGIVVFLACAGLKSGGTFAQTFADHGMQWILIGMSITILPSLVVGLIARGVFKLNYLTLTGLMAGSMTDPPALSFATQITKSDAPTIAYATVYPLVMLLRVMVAQALVIWLYVQ